MAWVIPERRLLIIPTKTPSKYDPLPVKIIREVDGGGYLVGVPHYYSTLTILANMGVYPDAPSPYELYAPELLVRGMYPLRPDQKKTAEFICGNMRGYVLHPPRLGKTNSALAAVSYLRQDYGFHAGQEAVLVVSPLSLLRDAWVQEAARFVPHLKVSLLHGAIAKRKKLLEEPADIYLLNCDAVKLMSTELMEAVRSKKIGMLIIDETTEFKNPGTKKYAALEPIAKALPRVIGMTGTAGNEEDVYGQINMITPDKLYRDGIMITKHIWLGMTTVEVGPYKRIPKIGSKKLIHETMQPAIRYEKNDVLKIPTLIEDFFESDMTAMQMKAYNIMKQDSIVGLSDGSITAANAGVRMAKLLQIASGSVITDGENEEDGGNNVKYLDMKNHLDNLERIINESESKVVIYSSWSATISRLVEELKKRGITAVKYDGKDSAKARQKNLDYWRDSRDCKVIIMHPVTGSYGIELAAADTMIFFGVPRNGKIMYDQARERLASPQQKSMTPKIVYMVLSPADRVGFKTLNSQADDVKSTMETFKAMIDA